MELIAFAGELLFLGIVIAILILWIKLWISLCDRDSAGEFIKSTLVLLLISFVICWFGSQIMLWFGNGETYAAQSVYGLLFLVFLVLFVPSCMIAFVISLVKFIRSARPPETAGSEQDKINIKE